MIRVNYYLRSATLVCAALVWSPWHSVWTPRQSGSNNDTPVASNHSPVSAGTLPGSWPANKKGTADSRALPKADTKPSPDGKERPDAKDLSLAEGPPPDPVFGTDHRERRSATLWPYRAIVQLHTTYGDCTGFFVSGNTIATAAHCLNWNREWTKVTLADETLANACRVVWQSVPRGWIEQKGRAFDYGAARLTCSAGNTRGWFGFSAATPKPGSRLYGLVGHDDLGSLRDGTPCDPCGIRGRVREVRGRVAYYEIDTSPGQSGSPIFQGNKVFGIHATGIDGTLYPGNTFNSGPWIDKAVYRNMIAWIRAPN